MSPQSLHCEHCGAEIMPAMIRCRHCNWRRGALIDQAQDEDLRPHTSSRYQHDLLRSAPEHPRHTGRLIGPDDDRAPCLSATPSGIDPSSLTANRALDLDKHATESATPPAERRRISANAPQLDDSTGQPISTATVDDDSAADERPPRRWTWRDYIPDFIYGLASDRTLALVGAALVAVGVIAGGAWWGPFSNADDVQPGLIIRPGAVRGFITSLAIADNGTLAAGRTHGQVEIWDTNTRQLIKTLATVRGKYVALCQNAACLIAGDEQQSRIYDLVADSVTASASGIRSLSVNAAGTHAVSLDVDRRVCVWDLQSGDILAKLPRRSSETTAVAIGPDGGECAFATRAGRIFVVDVASAAVVREIAIHRSGAIIALTFDRTGTRVAAVTADNRLHIMTGPIYDKQWGQAFSPGIPLVARIHWIGEDRILVSGGRQLAICSPQSKPEIATAELQSIDVLAASPDGRLAALGCRDEPAIVLHDLTTGRPLGILDVQQK